MIATTQGKLYIVDDKDTPRRRRMSEGSSTSLRGHAEYKPGLTLRVPHAPSVSITYLRGAHRVRPLDPPGITASQTSFCTTKPIHARREIG
jgi:cysteine sulfinate desulfinase/cysteine desulfurase-like protein